MNRNAEDPDPRTGPARRKSHVVEVIRPDAGWRQALPRAAALARTAARAALKVGAPACPPAELTVVLTDDAGIRALNRDWRRQDKPTNVLSFPANGLTPGTAIDAPAAGPLFLGDVVLARQTVLSEAEAAGKAIDHHVSHLVVHGTLHLLGFDHEEDHQAQAMEELETIVLARLGVPDPYREASRG